MKDNLILLVTGIICSLLSWAFFAYLQDSAFTILLLITAAAILGKAVKSKFWHSDKKPDE